MTKYKKRKEAARQAARAWQLRPSFENYSWSEIADIQTKFEKMAKNYGLTKEFKENGII